MYVKHIATPERTAGEPFVKTKKTQISQFISHLTGLSAEESTAKFPEIANFTAAAAGFAESVFVFTMPLLIHFGTGELGGQENQIEGASYNFEGLGRTTGNISLYQTHATGTLGIIHTVALTALAIYFGAPLIKEAVQNLRLPRFTLAELQAKFPELNYTDRELFALCTGMQDPALVEQTLALLQRQEVLTPRDTARQYAVNIPDDMEELRTAIFDLGLTIGQTDAVLAYLRNPAAQNAGLFFKPTLLGKLLKTEKFVARARGRQQPP